MRHPFARLIPRERFCVLAHGRATIASTPPERPQGFAPIELAAMDGAKTLFAEACP